MPLYLTYDTSFNNDGFGAQYQRIVGVFCLAKLIGAQYVHTPITLYEHLPIEYWKKIDDHFGLSKYNKPDNVLPVFDEVLTISIPNKLEELKRNNSNKNILIKIGLPTNILDGISESYDNVMEELRQIKRKIDLPEFKKDKTNISIHIRRGDVNANSNSDRYTDNNHYVKVIEKLNSKYANCNILIFTQNSENLDIFKQMKNVKLMNDIDIIETFEYLCNADVLILSKSSLSYLSGLYSESSDIYMEQFWHSKLPRWKYIDDLFDTKIESYRNIDTKFTVFMGILGIFLLFILLNYKTQIYKNIKKYINMFSLHRKTRHLKSSHI